MTDEELEKDYYADRPTEPYSDDDSPNDWANIAHYAEENLEKAFKRITELGKENTELKDKHRHDCPSCPAFGMHCPHKVNGDPYFYDCYLTVKELEKENDVLRKALNLYVTWADECGVAWDNFPDMEEKWYKVVEEKSLGWIAGLIYMVVQEAKEQLAKEEVNKNRIKEEL